LNKSEIPEGYVLVPVKWGNQQTAPGKDHLGMKHMMPVCVIDPKDPWVKAPKPGRRDKIAFANLLIDRKHKDTIKAMLEPTDSSLDGPIINILNYRLRSSIFDPVILSNAIDDASILTKWGTKGQAVNPVVLDELPVGLIKSSVTNSFDVEDVNLVTSGTYLIGGNTPDYATYALYFADLGNMTGAMDGRLDGHVVETATSLMTENLASYEFKLSSNSPPKGNSTKGYTVTRNFNEQLFNFQQEGPGSTVIVGLYIKTIATLTAGYSNIIFSTHSTDFTVKIYGCFINQNSERGLGITIADNTLSNGEIYGNTLWGGSGSVDDSIGIQIYDVSTGWELENNSIKDYRWCYDLNNKALTAQNNCGINASTADYRNIGSATGNNNAGSDTSPTNGNWNSGSGNQPSITVADEFMTLVDTNKDFFKVYQGGVCYNGGTAPGISGNNAGSRGNVRPYDGSNYSIGSDEYRIEMYFSEPPLGRCREM
jgi:hypothetical protein